MVEEKKITSNEALKVSVCGLDFDNPIIPASGTFGYGLEFKDLYDLNCLGSLALKGTTEEARYGNPIPRIAETPSGMLNAVGLQNPGFEEVLDKELPRLKKVFSKKVIANICGFSTEEYVKVAKAFDREEAVGILEINVSCPNVKHGGMSFGTDPSCAKEITQAVKEATTKPVFMKLTPNDTNIVKVAEACVEGGADGISLINTVLGMRIDLKRKKPLLANRTGGLSGPAIFPIAIRAIYDVYEAVEVPIMGGGGVFTAEDVLEMMLAGASLVQIGSANLVEPFTCPKIIEQLPETMKTYRMDSLAEAIGMAHES